MPSQEDEPVSPPPSPPPHSFATNPAPAHLPQTFDDHLNVRSGNRPALPRQQIIQPSTSNPATWTFDDHLNDRRPRPDISAINAMIKGHLNSFCTPLTRIYKPMRALSGGRVASPPHPPHPLPVPRQFLISSTPPQCPHTRILHFPYNASLMSF